MQSVNGTPGQINVVSGSDSATVSIDPDYLYNNVIGTVNQLDVWQNIPPQIQVEVDSNFLPTYVLGMANQVDITDMGGGVVRASLDNNYLSTYVTHTPHQTSITSVPPSSIEVGMAPDYIQSDGNIVIANHTGAQYLTMSTSYKCSMFGGINIVTASRALGSIYLNSLSSPMFVIVNASYGAAWDLTAYIGSASPPGFQLASYHSDAGGDLSLSFIVPAGYYYEAYVDRGASLTEWTEFV